MSPDAPWASSRIIKSVDSRDPRVAVLIGFALQFCGSVRQHWWLAERQQITATCTRMCMQSISNDCKESGLGGLYIFGNEAHTNLSLVSFFMLDLKSQDSLLFRKFVGKLGNCLQFTCLLSTCYIALGKLFNHYLCLLSLSLSLSFFPPVLSVQLFTLKLQNCFLFQSCILA